MNSDIGFNPAHTLSHPNICTDSRLLAFRELTLKKIYLIIPFSKRREKWPSTNQPYSSGGGVYAEMP